MNLPEYLRYDFTSSCVSIRADRCNMVDIAFHQSNLATQAQSAWEADILPLEELKGSASPIGGTFSGSGKLKTVSY